MLAMTQVTDDSILLVLWITVWIQEVLQRIFCQLTHMQYTGIYIYIYRDHGGAVVTNSSPTSEARGSNLRPYLGKLVVFLPMVGSYITLTNCMCWLPLPIKLPIVI